MIYLARNFWFDYFKGGLVVVTYREIQLASLFISNEKRGLAEGAD